MATPDVPAPTLAEARATAKTLVDKARWSRPPARWIDFAKAKHVLQRATGANAERVLLERGDFGAWAGDRVLAEAIVHTLPLGGTAVDADVLLDFERSSGRLEATTLIAPIADLSVAGGVVELPTGGFALQTPDGIQVRGTGHDPARPLDASGRLSLSPKRDLLVVTGDRVTLFDVSTLAARSTVDVAVRSPPVWSGDLLVMTEVEGHNVVVDPARGAALVDEVGSGALSPSGKTLAVLHDAPDASDGGGWSVSLYELPSAKKRVVALPGKAFTGPSPRFDGEDRLVVTEPFSTSRSCTVVVFSIVDVPHGRALAPPPGSDEECSTAITIGPTPSGFTASVDPGVIRPELLVRQSGKEVHRVPLSMRDGFGFSGIQATADERFVFACGSGTAASGAFVLDVANGRTTFTPTLISCNYVSMRDGLLFTPSGLLDLGADSPAWPTLVPLPTMPHERLAELMKTGTVASDASGLFCRIGEVLQPLEVCGPPR
ncbi:MAG: hypothetical protein U0414_21580 [Polyangiaceae bacterium]